LPLKTLNPEPQAKPKKNTSLEL
jgi:hypothetical protein